MKMNKVINKFIELYGEDVIENEASEEYSKKIIEIANNHFKKYSHRKMTLQELNKLCEA